MAKKAFTGDTFGSLPRAKREPYRLWFEYLKFALSEVNAKVDHKIYERWGDISNQDFDKWWDANWRQLFADPAIVTIMNSSEEFSAANADQRFVILRVAVGSNKKLRAKKIDEAISLVKKNTLKTRSGSTPEKYSITAGHSINYRNLRCILRFLQLMREFKGDIELAAIALSTSAHSWNEKVKAGKWKRDPVYVPPYIHGFADECKLRASTKGNGTTRRTATKVIKRNDTLRNQVRRYARMGEKILKNVSLGKFPGAF